MNKAELEEIEAYRTGSERPPGRVGTVRFLARPPSPQFRHHVTPSSVRNPDSAER